jgi:hypothetical protein
MPIVRAARQLKLSKLQKDEKALGRLAAAIAIATSRLSVTDVLIALSLIHRLPDWVANARTRPLKNMAFSGLEVSELVRFKGSIP